MNCPTKPALQNLFLFISGAVAAPAAMAAAPDDACALLTQAQVSAARGVPVGAGTYVTPTFKRTCTWSATVSGGGTVTLFLQKGDSFQRGKQMMQMASGGKPLVVTISGVGDDAYYFGPDNLVALIVKKGSIAFKVAVYAHIPGEQQKAIEKTLAQQVVSGL
jgi:hypothetical protein